MTTKSVNYVNIVQIKIYSNEPTSIHTLCQCKFSKLNELFFFRSVIEIFLENLTDVINYSRK